MFTADFEEAEVLAAMTDPTHGFSEKFLEEGRGGERYKSLERALNESAHGARKRSPRQTQLRISTSRAPRSGAES
jgi:hypothetical protein